MRQTKQEKQTMKKRSTGYLLGLSVFTLTFTLLFFTVQHPATSPNEPAKFINTVSPSLLLFDDQCIEKRCGQKRRDDNKADSHKK